MKTPTDGGGVRRTCQPVFFCLKETIPLAAGKVYRSLRGKDNALRLQQRCQNRKTEGKMVGWAFSFSALSYIIR